MHWTIALLFVLCGLTAALNIEQWAVTRTVRPAGILICTGWLVQETYWAYYKHDSFELFVICDALIIAWFLVGKFAGRTFDRREVWIAVTVPATTALGAYAELNDGHTSVSWWTNWTLVACQVVWGMPTPRRQSIGGEVSHGRLRRAQRGDA